MMVFLTAFTVIPVSMPKAVQAESQGQKVKFLKNVKFKSSGVTFWGVTPYVIYEIDGVEYNSLNMGAEFNGKVWMAMDDDSKKKSLEFFTDKRDRDKWFGGSTGTYQANWTEERTGWKAACEASARKWESRYTGDLAFYYEKNYDGDNDNFNHKWSALTAFSEGSDAHKVLTQYINEPEAAEFKAYNEIIPELKSIGKSHYNSVKKNIRFARRLAVQSISKELINIIVDNFMTPSVTLFGPGKATAATTDVVTNFIGLTDTLSDFSSSLKDMVGWDVVNLDDATKYVNQFSSMVDQEVYIAQEAWNEAENCARYMNSVAPGIITAIENRTDPLASRKAQEREKVEKIKAQADKPSVSDVNSGNAGSAGGENAAGSTGTEGEAEEEKAEEEQENEEPAGDEDEEARIARVRAELQADFAAWKAEVKSDANAMLSGAGYAIPDDDWTDEQISQQADAEKKDYWRFGKNYPTEYYDRDLRAGDDYYEIYKGSLIPDYGLERWAEDLAKQDALNETRANMRDSVIDAIPDLIAEEKGDYIRLADRVEQAKVGWERTYFDREAGEMLNAIADMMPYYGKLTTDQWRDQVDEIMSENGDYGKSLKKNSEQKAWIRDALQEWKNAKSNFDLAYAEYGRDLDSIRAVLNSTPEYAKKQAQLCSDSSTMSIVAGGTIPYYKKNVQELKDLINSSNNRAWLLRTEGEKLRDLYGGYCSYLRQLEIDQSHMKYYKNEMDRISDMFNYHYVYSDVPGIPNTYGAYSGKTYLELFGIDSSTFEPYSYSDPEYRVANGSGGVVTGISPDQEASIRSFSLIPSERLLGNVLLPLYTDLLGGSSEHAEFVQTCNKMKSMQGTLLRQMKNGDWTEFNSYKSQLESCYQSCSYYSYNGGILNPNRAGEVDFYKVLYSDDGLVRKLENEALTYIAANGIKKKGNNINGASGVDPAGAELPDLTLSKGRTGRLEAEVYPADATDRRIIWESLDPSVAVVDENGFVTSVSEGSVKIRAYAADSPAVIVSDTVDYEEVDEDDNVSQETMAVETYEIPEEFLTEFTVKVNPEAAGILHRISFDGNGASGSMNSVPIYEGDQYSLPYPEFAEPEGCEFAGWDRGQPGDLILIDSDLTLKAQWRALPKPETVTVSFESNGGSGSMKPAGVPKGDGYILPTCTFTPPEGSRFLKWNLGEPGEIITVTKDIQLYPRWIEDRVCWITFDQNGGTGTMQSVSVNILDSYTLPSCSFTPPEGSWFDAWNYGYAGSTIRVEDDIMLVPQWYLSDYSDCYFVSFSTDNYTSGSMYAFYVPAGQQRRLPKNTFVWEGHTFLGWDTKYPAKDVVYTDEQLLPKNLAQAGEGVHLYAVWGDAACEHPLIELRNSRAATCREDGYTGDQYCASCGKFLRAGKTIPAGPDHHVSELRGVIKGSCLAKGYSGDSYCKICGEKLKDGNETPENPDNHIHTAVSGNIAASCTKEGYSGDTWCSDCHRLVNRGSATKMLPHDYDEGVVTRKPDYFNEGEKLLTCRNCGAQTTESIPCLPVPEGVDPSDIEGLQDVLITVSGDSALEIVEETGSDGSESSVIVVGGKPVSEKVTKDGKTRETTWLWIGGLEEQYAYTGASIKPEIKVFDGMRTLKKGTDYTVSYGKNKEPGEGTLTVKYKGNYAGTAQSAVTFSICKAELGRDVIVRNAGIAESGRAQKPKPEIVWGSNGKAVKGKFSVTYLKDGSPVDSVQEKGEYIMRVEP
ncbi:MAG: InlB B-repeat-containing protein, partial [Lachnospiraceae bacterium]|nr:InlB B-repeat-containing protein [Lachnospiraceae bacterium]